MTAHIANQLEIVDHIAAGSRVIVSDVEWEDYLELIERLGDDSHLRISYSDGILEVMSPSKPNEVYKNLIHDLVRAIAYELEMDVISLGSFTMRTEQSRKAAEADDSFYIQHASSMIGRSPLRETGGRSP